MVVVKLNLYFVVVVVTLWCSVVVFVAIVVVADDVVQCGAVEHPKVAPTCGVIVCFWHFYFEVSFAPQPRALFEYLERPKVLQA